MQSFKLKDGSGNCRRFRLTVGDDLYTTLTKQVMTLYDFDREPKLSYFDEDNDRVQVGSQIELEAAIHSFPNLLVLEVEKTEEGKKEERGCGRGRGRMGRGGRLRLSVPGCGQGRGGGWGMWMMGMENLSEEEKIERKKMWKQRRVEMLTWKLECLSQKLSWVEGKMKETEGEDMELVVKQAVLRAKKEFIEQRILEISSNTTPDTNKDAWPKWEKMKGRRLQFHLNMISTCLNALEHLPDEQKKSDAANLHAKHLEMKKVYVEKQISSLEERQKEGEDRPARGCEGFRFRHPHHPYRRYHSRVGCQTHN